jgi:hypothetical protein
MLRPGARMERVEATMRGAEYAIAIELGLGRGADSYGRRTSRKSTCG